jgi:V8-like Glu-specific endopeptidase
MKIVRLFCAMVMAASILHSLFVLPARGEDAREIAKKSFPSVSMLVMEDATGQPLSLGSGFFVRKDTVATNLHVLAGATKGYAKIVGQKPKYDIIGFVAIDKQRDLVLLRIKDANAPGLLLGDSSTVAVGDEIFVIGNPQGLEGTFSKGIVSAVRSIGQDSLLQITAPISPGSSGGPVLNKEGKVVGVAVATFKEGQNLNFAIPVSYLSPLLTDTKALRPLKPGKDDGEKEESMLSDVGGRNIEGVVGRQFLWGDFSSFGSSVYFSFTLQNHFRIPVRNIACLVVFYDVDKQPIETHIVNYKDVISPGLAKRATGNVHQSVQTLTTRRIAEGVAPFVRERYEDKPFTPIEFRLLDFQIVEPNEGQF